MMERITKVERIMRTSLLATILPVFVLSGCNTTLESNRVEPSSSQATSGISYNLVRANYEVNLLYTLKDCAIDKGPEIKITPTVTTRYIEDLNHVYALDYSELSSWTKTSKLDVKLWENGALKSINAKATDQSAGVINNVVSTIGKVVGVDLPDYTVQKLNGTPVNKCSGDAVEQLKNLKKSKESIKTNGKALAEAKQELTRYLDNSEVNEETNEAIKKLKEKLEKLDSDIKSSKTTHDAALKFLNRTQTFFYDPEVATIPKSLQPLQTINIDWFTEPSSNYLHVYTYIKSLSETEFKVSAAASQKGIVYRRPVTALFMLCNRIPCANAEHQVVVHESKRLFSEETQVPQLGKIFYIPYNNEIFQNNEITANFANNGALTEFVQEDIAARAAALTSVIDGATDELFKLRRSKQAKKDASDAKNDKKAIYDAEASELDSKIKLIKLKIELNEQLNKLSEQASE